MKERANKKKKGKKRGGGGGGGNKQPLTGDEAASSPTRLSLVLFLC